MRGTFLEAKEPRRLEEIILVNGSVAGTTNLSRSLSLEQEHGLKFDGHHSSVGVGARLFFELHLLCISTGKLNTYAMTT
jgi:hypothetical protein